MWKLFLIFVIWAGVSYPVYKYIGPVAVVVYGVVTVVGFLAWAIVASGKKGDSPDE